MPPGIIESFALILVCILAGHLMARFGALSAGAPAVLNSFVINLAFPALVLAQVPKLLATTELDWRLAIPISAAWMVFGLVSVVVMTAKKIFGFSRSMAGALMITAGLGNTSFVGFPVIEAVYGEKGLATAVIIDQAGTFLVLSTLGLVCASYYSGLSVSARDISMRILKFPPFLALVAAGFLAFIDHVLGHALSPSLGYPSGYSLASRIYAPAQKLGSTLAPIALVSVGAQLKVDFNLLRRRARALALGLFCKLLLAPLMVFVLYVAVLKSTDLNTRVTVLEAAMGPMITGAIVAQEFGLDPELTSLMVGIGVPFSLVTICFWYLLVQGWLG
jgi:predicted permease